MTGMDYSGSDEALPRPFLQALQLIWDKILDTTNVHASDSIHNALALALSRMDF
jgi:hypothetical protein